VKLNPCRLLIVSIAVCIAGGPDLLEFRNSGLAAAEMAAHALPVTAPATNRDTTTEQVFEGMRRTFRADVARGVHARYQFRFKAPQAGDWWIIVNDGAFMMGKGTIDSPDVTFACTGSDWVELANGTLGGIRAYLTRRLHVNGSQALARKLDDMFP
jgi:putative sterol carrier protein